LRVKEIMDEKHAFIYEDELATKARATIRDLALRILPVVGEHRKLLGTVSRRTVMIISSSISPIRVKGIMADPKITALADDDVNETVRKMIKLDEWQIPVVNSVQEKACVGVLGLENFIAATIKTSPEKFSKNVSELMSKNVVTCSPEDEVDNIWRLMQTKSLAGLPVVKKDKLIGIVTERDLLEKGTTLPTFEAKKGRFMAPSKVSSIMRTGIVTVEPSIKAIRVAKIMVSKDIGRVPVVDEDGKLLGIVDREDIARLIFE